MLKKLVAGAVFAGFAAGLIVVLLQFAFVRPLLLEAEQYEAGTLSHFARVGGEEVHDHGSENTAKPANDHVTNDHAHPSQGFELRRDGLTVLFSIFVYAGFGMILMAGFATAESFGHRITPRIGLLWGLAGFAAFHLMPSFGLPIEVPGSAAADLNDRQIWWFGTAVATVVAAWLIGYGTNPMHYGLAVLALAAPHILGAPHPGEYYGPTPPELASLYASRALVTAMIGWSVLGLLAGNFWEKDHAE
ncbi:MAG: CbtA family protein [Rhodobacteraceae bacterium]|nr:CbtA family protein [Paracoccaceae bacterium]